jgi:hypothetical protein
MVLQRWCCDWDLDQFQIPVKYIGVGEGIEDLSSV